jgi:hypothetical protein
LIASHEIGIENLEYERAKVVSVNRSQRILFDGVPSGLGELRGCVSSRVRDKASVILESCQYSENHAGTFQSYIYYCFVVFHAAQYLESADSPLPALTRVY